MADAYLPSVVAEDRAGQNASTRVLCVDEHTAVLGAVRALLEANGYDVSVADSAAQAMRQCEGGPFDLVLASPSMPHTDSTPLLEQLQARWPETLVLPMTDGPDLIVSNGATSQAGLGKPWDGAALLTQIQLALDNRSNAREKAQRTRSRTDELRALNASLEQSANVSEDGLAQANKQLKTNFIVTLKVFSSLMETRRKHLVGHARRVADLARKLATRLQLEPALVHEVLIAGLLHDIGKLAFPDVLLDTPVASMTPRQLEAYRQHPARAEQLLMPLQDLRGAAASIASQLERFDGTGYPRQLQGRAILVGARILAVCADYDNLQIGMLAPRWLTPRQSLAVIERAAGKRYDPWVVNAFSALLRNKTEAADTDTEQDRDPSDATPSPAPSDAELLDDMLVGVNDLGAGDILSRDLTTPAGLMMLPAGHAIDDRLIRKMANFEKTDNVELAVYIRKPTENGGKERAE